MDQVVSNSFDHEKISYYYWCNKIRNIKKTSSVTGTVAAAKSATLRSSPPTIVHITTSCSIICWLLCDISKNIELLSNYRTIDWLTWCWCSDLRSGARNKQISSDSI